MIRTDNRTLMPAKMTSAGENTCEKGSCQRVEIAKTHKKHGDTHDTNALAESRRKCVKDVDGRDEPLRKSVVVVAAAMGFGLELRDLFSKNGEYGIGRVAGLKSG